MAAAVSQSLRPAAKGPPTIDEVARICGVSKGTVSKALNGRMHLVSKATRDEILRVANDIGFKPSWRARVLANKRSQMIALLHSSPNSSLPRTVYWEICDRLDELFRRQGYSITYIGGRETFSAFEQVLTDGRFDGVLGLGVLDAAVLGLIQERNLPCVLINTGAGAEWTRVGVDDAGGTREAMNHLLSLGHRRIAFTSTHKLDHPAWPLRYGTYRQCMTDADLTPIDAFVGPGSGFVDYFKAQPKDERPTAVLDFSHWSAISLLQWLWRADLRVPQDISVVTFNDAYPVTETIPPLTTVALPSHAMADHVAKLLMERIEDPDQPPETITLPERLVVRESTAPLRATGAS